MQKRQRVGFIVLIITILMSFFFVDYSRYMNNESIIFTPIKTQYKDGGTEVKYGLGYSVVSWHRLAVKIENGEEVRGVETGKEFLLFPKCYQGIFTNTLRPSKELQFIIEE